MMAGRAGYEEIARTAPGDVTDPTPRPRDGLGDACERGSSFENLWHRR